MAFLHCPDEMFRKTQNGRGKVEGPGKFVCFTSTPRILGFQAAELHRCPHHPRLVVGKIAKQPVRRWVMGLQVMILKVRRFCYMIQK